MRQGKGFGVVISRSLLVGPLAVHPSLGSDLKQFCVCRSLGFLGFKAYGLNPKPSTLEHRG